MSGQDIRFCRSWSLPVKSQTICVDFGDIEGLITRNKTWVMKWQPKLEDSDVHMRKWGLKNLMKFCKCIPSTVFTDQSIIIIQFCPKSTSMFPQVICKIRTYSTELRHGNVWLVTHLQLLLSSTSCPIPLELHHGNLQLAVTHTSTAWLWLLSKNFTTFCLIKSVVQTRKRNSILNEAIYYILRSLLRWQNH
jgi:hypothetical protein